MTVRTSGQGNLDTGTARFTPSATHRDYQDSSAELPLGVKAANEIRKAEQSIAARKAAELRAGSDFAEKLMTRLASESRSLRLYETLIHKCESQRSSALPLIELWIIRNEKDEHIQLVQDCMRRMQVFRVTRLSELDASLMAPQILNDPCSSLTECLEIMLCIEMREHAAWELLANESTLHGLPDMTERLNHALGQKSAHLGRMRAWYEEAVGRRVA